MKVVPASLAAIALCAFAIPGIAGEPVAPPTPRWESSAALGLTVTRGNSDTILFNANATTSKKWENNEISLGADAAYGRSKSDGESDTTAASTRGFVQYNRLFNERFFGYARIEGLHDDVARIAYRITVGPGVGYYFIKDKKTDLSVEIGPSLITERVGGEDKSYMTLRLGEKFHHPLSDRARIWQTLELLPEVTDIENFIMNAEIGIEADITVDKKLTLRSYLQDTYDNVPAEGRRKNDAKLVSALAYKF